MQEIRAMAMRKRTSRMLENKKMVLKKLQTNILRNKSFRDRAAHSSVPLSEPYRVEKKIESGMFFFEQENANKVIKLEMAVG
jgi:hypothetical protein